MKKIVLFCLLTMFTFQVKSQTIVATRIRDLVLDSSLTSSTYFVMDRAGYTTLKKIAMSNIITYLKTYFAPIYSPVFTGVPTTTLPYSTDNSLRIPTTSWVRSLISGYISTTGGSSYKVKVFANDSIPDYLSGKLSAGDGISLAISGYGVDGYSVIINNTRNDLGSLVNVNTVSAANKDPLCYDASDSLWKPLSQISGGHGGLPDALSKMSDVDISTKSGDQLLKYNSGTATWQAVSLVLTDTVAPMVVSVYHSIVHADFIGQMYINTKDTTHIYFSLDKIGKWRKFSISY